MRKIFIFIHLQKCGGTSFNHILRRNFGENFLPDYSRILHKKYSIEDVINIINYNKYISCFSSHGFSIKLPYDLEKYDITAISFIRNPVDRFISHYYYHKSLDAKNEIIEETKNTSLDAYIEKSFSEKNINNFINFQFRELTCTTNNEELDSIINFIKINKLYLFPLDYFDESCLLLNNLFPEFFHDCSYIKKTHQKL